MRIPTLACGLLIGTGDQPGRRFSGFRVDPFPVIGDPHQVARVRSRNGPRPGVGGLLADKQNFGKASRQERQFERKKWCDEHPLNTAISKQGVQLLLRLIAGQSPIDIQAPALPAGDSFQGLLIQAAAGVGFPAYGIAKEKNPFLRAA